MKTKFFLPALFSALLLGSTGCKDKNNEEDSSFSDMTVAEQKEYVGSVAEELSDLLAGPEVKNNVEFLDYLSTTYGDNYDDNDHDYYYSSRIRSISRSYELAQFADITGEYRWNGYEFKKVRESDDFTAIIPNDPRYKEIKINVKASKDGDIVEVEDYGDTYGVKVPHTIEGTITANGIVMMTQKVTSSGLNGDNVNASNVTTLGGLVIDGQGQASPTKATVTTTMSINGMKVAGANADITGSSLTDRDRWEADLDSGYDFYISDYIKNVVTKADILNKVQIFCNAKMNVETDKAQMNYYTFGSEYSDYMTQADALAACQKGCDVLNKAWVGYVTFNNTDTRQATISYVPYLYEYYKEYEILTVLKFSDGSTYSDGMFDGVFDKALNQWQFLFR